MLLQNKLYHIEKTLARTGGPKSNTTYDQNAGEIRIP
jgi:hypothetical protein